MHHNVPQLILNIKFFIDCLILELFPPSKEMSLSGQLKIPTILLLETDYFISLT